MNGIMDRVRAAFVRKQIEAAETYGEIVLKLANDHPVTEAVILSALDVAGKAPDELQADIEREHQRIELRNKIAAATAVVNDVPLARREQTTLIEERDRELSAINARYQPQIDACDSRILQGESTRAMLSRLENTLAQLGNLVSR